MGKIANTFDVSDCNTIQQVLTKSGTDWEPLLVRPYAADYQNVQEEFDPCSFRAIINPANKTALGFVRGKYKTQSHVQQLAHIDPLVTSGELLPVSVSMWDNGALIAYQFQAPNLDKSITTVKGVSPLFTMAFYHDGKGSDVSFFSDFRWFCKNQLGRVSDAVNTQGSARIRHMGENRINYADLVSGQIANLRGVLQPRYQAMAAMQAKALKGKDLLSFFGSSLGMQDPGKAVEALHKDHEKPGGEAKTLKDVLAAYREDPTEAPNSVWHAFNGVTRYITHSQGRNPATRAARALLGPGQATIGRAFTLASQMAA